METYLAHRGILGMKVGIRRYQNEDGTLTSAGKRHIISLEGKKESQKSRYDAASKKSREKKLEKAEKLSAKADKFMDKAQAKIAKYDRKISEIDPSKASAGRDYVDKLLKEP